MKAKLKTWVLVKRKVVYSRCQQAEKMADSCLKAHLHISVQAEVFIRMERGSRTKRSRGGCWKFSSCGPAQSTPIRTSKLVKQLYASSWFYSWRSAPRAGMTEGWSVYLLKLVPRILIQTCCLSTRYILVRDSIYRNNVKRMVGWVTVPHYYKPLKTPRSLCWSSQQGTANTDARQQVASPKKHNKFLVVDSQRNGDLWIAWQVIQNNCFKEGHQLQDNTGNSTKSGKQYMNKMRNSTQR